MNTPDPVIVIEENQDFCPELQAFYETYGATTIAHKIANLERELGRSNMHSCSGTNPVPDELRLAIYEQQWQVAQGLIAPTYC